MPLTNTDLKAIELPIDRAFMKIFHTFSNDIVKDCHWYMGVLLGFVLCVNRSYFVKLISYVVLLIAEMLSVQ